MLQRRFHKILSLGLSLSLSLVLVLVLVLVGGSSAIAQTTQADPAALAQAVQEIEYLDTMRHNLAGTLEGSSEVPTAQTFKAVCKPVGMRAQQLSQEHGWQVKQIAQKYRNPAHAPDNLNAKIALARFEQNPDLVGFWDRETVAGQPGTRYYRRINLEASCLACHGAKANRPQFVKDNYPQDRAYDFQVGELRGMYAVFIPDVQAALQDAVQQQ